MSTPGLYPAPPAWVVPGVAVAVDVVHLERGHHYDEGEIAAVVMYVGCPETGRRTGGPVYLRPVGGGREVTAPGTVLRRR